MIRIAVKEVGKNLKLIELENSDEDSVWNFIREKIGGGLELVQLTNRPYELVMYVDEDGMYKELPVNFRLQICNPYVPSGYSINSILGTVVIARSVKRGSELEYVDLTERDIEVLLNITRG